MKNTVAPLVIHSTQASEVKCSLGSKQADHETQKIGDYGPLALVKTEDGQTMERAACTPGMAEDDAFISYNHEDAAVARDLACALRAARINVWFDEWSLKPGVNRQEAHELAIQSVPVALVLWGANGAGAWGNPKMRACLQQSIERGLVIIPVLMPGATEEPQLPPFLSQLAWADLRNGPSGEPFQQLLMSILGGVRMRAEARSVASLVDVLIALLSKRRDHKHDSSEFVALSARIDLIVREIQQRFRPRCDSVVAGARLIRVIGTGNFGTIWEGQTVDTRERVAVKVFRLERLTEGQMLARFRRSIRAMRLLGEKKRIARSDSRGAVVRFGEVDETTLAFSMEYLGGGNLEKVSILEWSTSKKIRALREIAAAVQFAHENGVIHRDIKPANVVLNSDNRPVLTDFDIADVKWATSLSTTIEGGLGTPVFAAPEQLEDSDKADERADVYSLGRLLYFLLLERSPGYEIEKDPSLVNLGGFPPALVEVVRRATQYVPEKRFLTVADMIRRLESVETGWARLAARGGRGLRWMRRNLAALIIVLLAIGGVSGWAYARNEQVHFQREQRYKYERLAWELQRVATRGDQIRYSTSAVKRQISLTEELLPYLSGEVRAEEEKTLKHLRQRLDDLKRQEASNRKELKALELKLDENMRERAAATLTTTSSYPHTEKDQELAVSCDEKCSRYGFCMDRDGKCIATPEGCAASEQCRRHGYCEEAGGKCVVNTQSCAASKQCQLYGLCGERAGQCVATAEGCLASRICRADGRCIESAGRCIATESLCESWDKCKQFGYCTEFGGQCIATPDGCKASEACVQSGYCVARGGNCIAIAGSCMVSTRCRFEGFCGEHNGICVPTEEGCRESEGCKQHGRCYLRGGRCVGAAVPE